MTKKQKAQKRIVWHVYRNSKTGQLVTETYAKHHPSTTQREKMRRPA